MPLYEYEAAKLNGKSVKGKQQAQNQQELRKQLEDDGLYLVSSKEADVVSGKPLKAKQLSEFCRELGMMIGAGVPLIRALNVMVQRDVHPKLKSVYVKLHQGLQRGLMLSEAMTEQGRTFPELLINMYRASEASGNMEETCEKMAVHYEKSYKLSQKVRSSLIYPIILVIVTFIVVLFIFLVILPKFFSLFDDMETPIPGITRFMINISKVLQHDWMYIITGILILILILRGVGRLPQVRVKLDALKLKLPIVGKLMRTIYTARFARTLCSCYSSGISIVSALENTRQTIGNKFIAMEFDQCLNAVRNGETLSAAVGMIRGFDPKLAASIMIGEETGRLDRMLNDTANAFDFEADIALGKLTATIEPVLIVFMAVIIGTIMVSVILPLPTMYNAVGSQGGM